jgi:hypothetical protein
MLTLSDLIVKTVKNDMLTLLINNFFIGVLSDGLIDKWVVFDVLDGLHFKFRFKFFME